MLSRLHAFLRPVFAVAPVIAGVLLICLLGNRERGTQTSHETKLAAEANTPDGFTNVDLNAQWLDLPVPESQDQPAQPTHPRLLLGPVRPERSDLEPVDEQTSAEREIAELVEQLRMAETLNAEEGKRLQSLERPLMQNLLSKSEGSASGSPVAPQVWHQSKQRPTVARVYLGDKNSLELVSLQVSVTIDGLRARTVVDHIFHNPHDKQLEGTFEYPLPTGASPSYFAMFLGQTRARHLSECLGLPEKTTKSLRKNPDIPPVGCRLRARFVLWPVFRQGEKRFAPPALAFATRSCRNW